MSVHTGHLLVPRAKPRVIAVCRERAVWGAGPPSVCGRAEGVSPPDVRPRQLCSRASARPVLSDATQSGS